MGANIPYIHDYSSKPNINAKMATFAILLELSYLHGSKENNFCFQYKDHLNIKRRGFNTMIISDLQYIESADNSEVQGGYYGYYGRSANANADGDAQAYGDYTSAYSNTNVVADANNGFSGANSKSSASASNYGYYYGY
jgi:hypothetical protein